MRKQILPALLLLCCSTALAQQRPSFKDSTAITRIVAERYIQHYTAVSFDSLEWYMHPDYNFLDPTAEYLFGWNPVIGKEKAAAFFRANYSGLKHPHATITRRIFSGNLAVFEMDFAFSFEPAAGKPLINIKMPLVTTVKISGGKVIEHRDYGDYTVYLAQVRQQTQP